MQTTWEVSKRTGQQPHIIHSPRSVIQIAVTDRFGGRTRTLQTTKHHYKGAHSKTSETCFAASSTSGKRWEAVTAGLRGVSVQVRIPELSNITQECRPLVCYPLAESSGIEHRYWYPRWERYMIGWAQTYPTGSSPTTLSCAAWLFDISETET